MPNNHPIINWNSEFPKKTLFPKISCSFANYSSRSVPCGSSAFAKNITVLEIAESRITMSKVSDKDEQLTMGVMKDRGITPYCGSLSPWAGKRVIAGPRIAPATVTAHAINPCRSRSLIKWGQDALVNI